MNNMKVAQIGIGRWGKNHLRNYVQLGAMALACDLDQKNIDAALQLYPDLKTTKNIDDVFGNPEIAAVVIATPASTHFALGKRVLESGKHVFIEKPVTSHLKEAKQLQSFINEAGICFQVGHVERFNPAFIAAKPYIENPTFIEVHRLAQYNSRGTDVSVVLDLMMHDLDLILSIIKSNIRKIHVSGGILVSSTADIVNARIEFENGCVANITTNRVAFRNSRKFRIFDRNALININLLDKITEVIRIKNAAPHSKNLVIEPGNGLPSKEIIFEHPIILPTNAINEELNTFYQSVNSNKPAKVGIEDAIRVLELAFDIEEQLKL